MPDYPWDSVRNTKHPPDRPLSELVAELRAEGKILGDVPKPKFIPPFRAAALIPDKRVRDKRQ